MTKPWGLLPLLFSCTLLQDSFEPRPVESSPEVEEIEDGPTPLWPGFVWSVPPTQEEPSTLDAGVDAAIEDPPMVERGSSSKIPLVESVSGGVDAGSDSGVDAGADTEVDAGDVGDAGPDAQTSTLGCDIEAPSGECFAVETTLQTWQASRNACRARGPSWDLVEIHSRASHDFVAGLLVEEAWIGASDATQEARWFWVRTGIPFWSGDETGEPLDGAFANWNSTEPQGGRGSNCARMLPLILGAWGDLECTELRASVCSTGQY